MEHACLPACLPACPPACLPACPYCLHYPPPPSKVCSVLLATAAATAQASPLLLMDCICKWAFAGDSIGRLGCHFYGCCFGARLLEPSPTPAPAGPVQQVGGGSSGGAYSSCWPSLPPRWPSFLGVAYLDAQSSVTRLRPELQGASLLPTQVRPLGHTRSHYGIPRSYDGTPWSH